MRTPIRNYAIGTVWGVAQAPISDDRVVWNAGSNWDFVYPNNQSTPLGDGVLCSIQFQRPDSNGNTRVRVSPRGADICTGHETDCRSSSAARNGQDGLRRNSRAMRMASACPVLMTRSACAVAVIMPTAPVRISASSRMRCAKGV